MLFTKFLQQNKNLTMTVQLLNKQIKYSQNQSTNTQIKSPQLTNNNHKPRSIQQIIVQKNRTKITIYLSQHLQAINSSINFQNMSRKSYECYEIEDFFCHQSSQCSSLISSKIKQQNSTYDSLKCKKLIKNRISAQNSRIKKKMYIDTLEKNQRQLIRQIQQTQKQIQKTNQQLNTILTKNKQNDSFNHDQKHTYQRLKQLIRTDDVFDQDEAMMLIQLLINRVGVTGKQRRRMTDYYSKRMVNFSIPAIYRYLLHASTQDKGLLAEQNSPMYSWDQQFYQKVTLTPQQKSSLLQSRQKVAHQKHSWIQKIQAFEQVRSQIYKTSFQVEENLLEMRYMLNTRQMGEIICRIQNRKYNRDLTLGESQFERLRRWEGEKKGKEQEINQYNRREKQKQKNQERQYPVKKVKIEEEM